MNYNVPMIIKMTDSLGNVFYSPQISRNSTGRGLCDLSSMECSFLRPTDTISIEVDVDPNFNENEFTINWVFDKMGGPYIGKKLVLTVENKHVKEDFVINCIVKSKNDWHRCGDCDDAVAIIYKVLPPI